MNSEEAYKLWLKKQKQLEPALPLRMMADIAGVAVGTVQGYIADLLKKGKVEQVGYGNKSQYRMIEK